MRLAWAGFQDWIVVNHVDDLPTLNKAMDAVHELHMSTCYATRDAVLQNEPCKQIVDVFLSYMATFKCETGPLQRFG